jgi:seryl-tRNA synthetase
MNMHSKMLDLMNKRQQIEVKRNQLAKKRKIDDEEIPEGVDPKEWGIQRGKQLKVEYYEVKEQESALKDEVYGLASRIPNSTHPESPIGPEENAKVVQLIGNKPEFAFKPKDHIELGLALDWFDLESSTTISGVRTVMLKNMGAALEVALTNWVVGKLVRKGFKLILPSDFVRKEFVSRCGFLPGGQEITSRHVYQVDEELCLAGTSELTLTALHFDTILRSKDLPKKYVGVSHCFRPESPHGGQESRGLYRLHQFSKVEMIIICHPEESENYHKELLQNEIEIFSELGLHCRVLDMPTEELGAPAYRKYDIEAWMPGRDAFGEVIYSFCQVLN